MREIRTFYRGNKSDRYQWLSILGEFKIRTLGDCLFPISRYGMLTSNTSECFNARVGEEQMRLPVLLLVKHIVRKVSAKMFEWFPFARKNASLGTCLTQEF